MITNHPGLIQGSTEWLQERCGMLTASCFNKLITPTFRLASNDKSRMYLWEMAAQRLTGHVEPSYIGDHMLRGHQDEIEARELYSENFAAVEQVGFITNDSFGFTLGCSPDGLVRSDGLIEVKSRLQKYLVQALVEYQSNQLIPLEFMPQIQAQLMITGREWCDLIIYCGGMPMLPMHVEANEDQQELLLEAAGKAEVEIGRIMAAYNAVLDLHDFVPTHRRIEEEMIA